MRRFVLAMSAVAVLVIGGVAYAQTTGAEQIYACVSNGDGSIRQVAGADVACSKGWHKLNWSAGQAHIPVTTTYVVEQQGVIASQQIEGVTANCNSGDVVTGGGIRSRPLIAENPGDLTVPQQPGNSGAINPPTGYTVVFFNRDANFSATVRTFAICQHTE